MKKTYTHLLAVILMIAPLIQSIPLSAEEYSSAPNRDIGQISVSPSDLGIVYSEKKKTDTTIIGNLYSIEYGKYASGYVMAPAIAAPTTMSTSVFKNPFDCILTRTLLDFGGQMSLDLYRAYQSNPDSCMYGTPATPVIATPLYVEKPETYVTIGSYMIESENHGRPKNPAVIINPERFDATLPQAWSQTITAPDGSVEVDWYYNALGAKVEGDFIGVFIPFEYDFSVLLSLNKDALGLRKLGYATLADPLMFAFDTASAYYWTSNSSGTPGYEYGMYYDPSTGRSMSISIPASSPMILPVRFMRW